MACLNIQDMHPFFQVLVYLYTGPNLESNALPTYVADEYRSTRHQFSFHAVPNNDLLAYEVQHLYPPTWLRGESAQATLNSEHDLILVYRKGDYVFVHVSCPVLSNAVVSFFSPERGFLPINGDLIVALASSNDMQIRTIGIHNVYGSSGVAPQSKSYSGRDMRDALSSTNDGGFSFEYATGVRVDPVTLKAKPFGCSLQKNKIWMSWSADLSEFVSKCEELIDAFQNTVSQGFSVLASPVNPAGYQLDPVFFSLDYYVHKKGLLVMSADGTAPTADWECSYVVGSNSVQVVIGAAGPNPVAMSLNLTRSNDSWKLGYADPAKTIQISFLDEDADETRKRKVDLIKYLEDHPIFTVIFSCGLAFRNGRYWKDTRYATPFTRSEGSTIVWTSFDITTESRKQDRTDTIGDAIVAYLAGAVIGVDDDGAGEVADYVVAPSPDSLTLVHAKYSSSPKPGLRVDDLQVVCSQAIKNLPFFSAVRLAPKVSKWSKKQFTSVQLPSPNFEDSMTSIIAKMPALDKELWIVQPGISKSQLEADPGNKIHVLLNHVDAQCRQNGVRFRFICSN